MNAMPAQRYEPVPRRKLALVGEERLCQGPLHPEGEWLPPSAFYKDGDRRLKRTCKRCFNHARRPQGGWIVYTRLSFAVEELVIRLGMSEAARRSGLSPATLRRVLQREGRYMHRDTATKLIVALRAARLDNEMRHIDSVRHGAAMRGRKEKRPKSPDDYYRTKAQLAAEAEAKRLEALAMKQRSVARLRRRKRQREWVARKRALLRSAKMRGVEPMDLYWTTAREVCTPKQLRVLELKEQHGFSLRQIALACDIAVSTVRIHLDAAHRNIHKALKASV